MLTKVLQNNWPMYLILLILAIFGMCTAGHTQQVNISIIEQIESGGNPSAYNRYSGAVGLCQITPAVIMDYARGITIDQNGEFPLYMSDMTNGWANSHVANWYINIKIPKYLKYYGIRDTLVHRLWAYNAGIKAVREHRIPYETKLYIEKYYGLIRKGNK